MRSAITQVSSLLFGASVLIFMLALIIPLLSESPSLAEKGETVDYRSPSTPTEVLEDQEHMKSPAVQNELKPTITQLQDQVAQNQSNGLAEPAQALDTSGLASGKMPNETAILDPNPGVSSTTPELAETETAEAAAKPANPIGAEEQSPSQHEPTTLLVLGDGLFAPGDTSPRTNMQEAIEKIIPLIKERPLDKIVVEGHADQWTSDGVSPAQASKLNQIVSLRRASEVAKVLEQQGISRGSITVKGLGDAVPLASNATQEGRAKNRRVEIKLKPAQE